ncbi:helix-turn-helix domain-containing protein [Clostridium botulinum]|uniref:helix-turn-helix domain-containing protein n=1 Tax=Clostridium botulinum TaxID=1491 RepID=UPI000947300A|nr:helix-turn-helix transcriptional regulator [Clostridium botulinum]APQ97917.1 helix-turn-helix family protein [Clostridium botulinum]MBN3361640.1 XRE family transcriptional regulator [Clostridium botulinum]
MSSTFGKRFKMLRLEKNLKQQELIDDFNKKYHYGFTKSAVSQYENDKRIPEIEALNAFANYFNVSVDFLLGRSDIKNIDNKKDTSINKEEAETLAEEFLDLLIKHKKIKTTEDLTPQNILKLLNEIFDEIDKEK